MPTLYDILRSECQDKTVIPSRGDHHGPPNPHAQSLQSSQANGASSQPPFCTEVHCLSLLESLANYQIGNAPQVWTVESANSRAEEVFSVPGLYTENNLPPEAALIFMPKRPKFPPLIDDEEKPLYSPRFPLTVLADIPWLPYPFPLDTRGWLVTLYMVYGATVKDMAARVCPGEDPSRDQTQLENRILKKSLDYRGRHGGFGQDIRPIKGNRVTENSQKVIMGQTLKDHDAGKTPERRPLDQFQIIFVSAFDLISAVAWGLTWPAGCDLGGTPRTLEDETSPRKL